MKKLRIMLTKTACLLSVLLIWSGCASGRLSKSEQKEYMKMSAKNLTELGQTYFNQKNYNRAISTYKVILKKKDVDSKYKVQAMYEMGFCHYYKKEFSKAAEYFKTVLSDYKDDNAKTYRILAEKLLKKIKSGNTKGV